MSRDKIAAIIGGRPMTAEQFQRYLANRRATWRRDNPAQAADIDAAEADAAAARAAGEDPADVAAWLRTELDDIDRQYSSAHSEGWYDDTPHVRGVWEL
jgi:hypothetical protein